MSHVSPCITQNEPSLSLSPCITLMMSSNKLERKHIFRRCKTKGGKRVYKINLPSNYAIFIQEEIKRGGKSLLYPNHDCLLSIYYYLIYRHLFSPQIFFPTALKKNRTRINKPSLDVIVVGVYRHIHLIIFVFSIFVVFTTQ